MEEGDQHLKQAVQEERCDNFTEADDDEVIARRVFQLPKCSGENIASIWHAARPRALEDDAGESDGVEKR